MKVLYQIPSLNNIYAGRTIFNGYKNAFIELGHQFHPLTSEDDFQSVCDSFHPDIFITSLNQYNLKFIDLEVLNAMRRSGLIVLVNTPLFHSPMSKFRVNENKSLSKNFEYLELIKSGCYGDVYFNSCEQDDQRMEGFSEITGYSCHTIPLAADKTINFHDYDAKFYADVSYIGTYLPEKRNFFKETIFPLQHINNVQLYGQDWTLCDRLMGAFQKTLHYVNFPLLKSIQKPKLQLSDERKIYSTSTISINVHEEYQKFFGGDCNERTFKIPLCGGFQIVDNVECIKKYFTPDSEIIF